MAAATSDGWMRSLLADLRAQGWRVSRTKRRGHLRLEGPNGQLVFSGGTPGDHRAYLNLRAQLRRAGAIV